VNCAEEDRRDSDPLAGVTPPTPCREFIEAFLWSVGVAEREFELVELGDRWSGLRGGFPIGEGGGMEFVRCIKVFDGDAGEEGRAVADVEAIEIRLRECDRFWSWFVD